MTKAVHKWFPFSSAPDDSDLRCPKWAKALLYQYYTLKDVKQMIMLYNLGCDQFSNKKHAHTDKLSQLIIDDIDIQQYNGSQVYDLGIE